MKSKLNEPKKPRSMEEAFKQVLLWVVIPVILTASAFACFDKDFAKELQIIDSQIHHQN